MRCWRFTTAAYVSHVTKADFFLCSHCSTPVRFFYITGSAFLKLRSRRSYLGKKNRLDKNKKKTAEPLIKTAQTQNYRKKTLIWYCLLYYSSWRSFILGDEILVYDFSDKWKLYWVVFSCSTVYFAVQFGYVDEALVWTIEMKPV